jgi:integrase
MKIYKYVADYISENDLKPGTVVNYEGLASLLKSYERSRASEKKEDKELFVKEFMEYCFKKRGMVNSSVRNRMLQLKAVSSFYDLGLPINIRELFRGKKTVKNREVFLTHSEVMDIYNCDQDFTTSEKKALDVLVFLCQTGVRIGDVKQLKKDNIYVGIGDTYSFDFIAEKTGKHCSVPLSNIALEIIERNKSVKRTEIITFNYNYLSKILPIALEKVAVRCSTLLNHKIKINQYKGSKVISENVPKHKAITFHVGRHSYGAYLLEKGLPIAKVSYILGHDSIATTERFYKHMVGDSIKADVLNILNS